MTGSELYDKIRCAEQARLSLIEILNNGYGLVSPYIEITALETEITRLKNLKFEDSEGCIMKESK